MSRQRPRTQHQDRGATLILTIGFMLMISAIGGGLAALATTSMNSRNTLELVRNRQYAADGAIERAISWMRLQPGPATVDCAAFGSRPAITFNGIAIRVDWNNTCPVVRPAFDPPASDGTVVAQRNVIFSACVATTAACSDVAVPPAAAAPVIIRAQVNFAPASGPVTRTFVQSWSVRL